MMGPFFCSWSGGKDSCLALYYAMKSGGTPKYLFTMLEEGGEYSRSHRIPKAVLQQQSKMSKIPIMFNSTTWEDYEKKFSETLKIYEKQNIKYGVFGDIDIEEHREWCKTLCEKNNIEARHTLWKCSRDELITEFLNLGFKTKIVAVKVDSLDPEWLGRTLDKDMIKEFKKIGIDICGERGEYHTIVTDGPIFDSEIRLVGKNKILKDGYWFLDLDC